MKKMKIFMAAIVAALFFTGCGSSENVKLDLEKITEELGTLSSKEFFMPGVLDILDTQEEVFFENAEDVYYNLNEKFGLTEDSIVEYSIRINEENYDMYLILKPAEGKKDDVKNEMNTYFASLEDSANEEGQEKIKNRLEKEYQGYLFYIVTNNKNEEVYNLMISSKSPVFSAMMDVPEEALEMTFGINPELVEEYTAKVPMMIVNSNMYLIIKPKEGKENEVKEAINTYMKNLEDQWSTYLPDQYELVKNRKEEKIGNYLVYIVSNDNESAYNTVKNNKIK